MDSARLDVGQEGVSTATVSPPGFTDGDTPPQAVGLGVLPPTSTIGGKGSRASGPDSQAARRGRSYSSPSKSGDHRLSA